MNVPRHQFDPAQELRHSEAKFRGLLESAPDAIVIVDQEGSIAFANHQMERLFGYTSAELIGKPIEVLVPERLRAIHTIHRQRYNAHPQVRPMGAGLELYARRRDGTEFPVEISLSPMQLDHEFLVTAVIRDVSLRKQEEAALRRLHQLQLAQAEHLATLGEIAAGLAHEIKNPLAGISAALEVLAADFSPGDPNREIMEEVQQQVVRIKATIDELLNYARPRPLQLIRQDLNHTVEHVIHFAQQQAASRQVQLVFVPGAVPPVVHDVDQIQRTVLNLLLNAVQAVGSGGKIEVVTDTATYSAGSAGAPNNASGEAFARVVVRDNGPGIPEDDLEKIFRPFYTTKGHSGTGLGLSICRRIAELHHGTIHAESRVGDGSTFILALPLLQPRRMDIAPSDADPGKKATR